MIHQSEISKLHHKHSYFKNKINIKLSSLQGCWSYDMGQVYQQSFGNVIKGIIYKGKKTVCAYSNTSRIMIFWKEGKLSTEPSVSTS